MIYILFSSVIISTSSQSPHNYDYLYGMQSSFEYSQNYDEIKVLDFHTAQIDKYDQLKEKFISYSLGIDLSGQSILQVISKFIPFDDEQRVDILTNTSNVYTIRYHKFFNGRNTSKKYTLQDAQNCSSIAYLDEQFVVLCNKPIQQIFIQNGTKISMHNSQIKINEIQSFFGGLVVLCENLLIIYNENLIFEEEIYLNYIQLITTEDEAHILTNENVFTFFSSFGGLNYFHNCSSKPLFMEVIAQFVYVQCEKITLFIDQKPISYNIQAKSFSSTFEYLIIDNTKIYDKYFYFQYYVSNTPLYPVNFENQAVTIKENMLYVGEIIGLYLVKINESIFLHFATIFAVGQGLQSLHIEEDEFIREEKIFFYLNYLSGPDIQIAEGGISTETKKIKINNDIVTAFKGLENYIGFIYQYEKMLSISFCILNITYDEALHQCESETDFLQLKYNIAKSQSLMIQPSNQLILFILDGKILRIFNLFNAFEDIYDVLDFYYGYQVLVVIKYSTTLFYYINEEQYQMIAYLKLKCQQAAISEKTIALLIENNILITLRFSINGLYKSSEEKFTEKILSINYVQNQLLVTLKDRILVYEQKILRGKVDLDMRGNIKFIQSEKNLYIYNQTTVYVFQIYKEISLSSYLQQIIVAEEEIKKLQAVSNNGYELLLINNDLYILEALRTFQLVSIVDQDQFANQIHYKLNFTNRYNETAQLKFKKYGDTLKLKAVDCNETFEVNKIEVNKIFDGPVQNVEGDNNIQVIQRVELLTTQQFWFNKNVSYILPLQSNDQIIVIFNKGDINLCDKFQCQLLLQTQSLCRHLEEDSLYFYAVCGELIFRGLKEAPQILEQLPLTLNFSQQHLVKFNGSYILGYSANTDIEWEIFQDYQFKLKINNGVQFKVFETDKIIALSFNNIIIYDLNFIQIKQFEFYPLLKQHQIDFLEEHLYLEDIIKIEENQYIITSSDVLVFEIIIHSDYVEIVRIYSSLFDIMLRELILIDSNIFMLVGNNFPKREYYIEFYDRRHYNIKNKIIPYFHLLTLTQEIYRYSITVKKTVNNRILVLMAGGDLQEYVIHNYIQILNGTEVANNTQTIQLIAYDGKIQKQKNTVNIKPSVEKNRQIYDIKIIYSIAKQFGIILIIVVILILVRQGRRYILQKKMNQENQLVLQKKQEILKI